MPAIIPETGKRQQVRRRYATEKQARDALAEISQQVATNAFVSRTAVMAERTVRRLARVTPQRPPDNDQRLRIQFGPVARTARAPRRAEAHTPGPGQAADRPSRWRHQDREGPAPPGMVAALTECRNRRLAAGARLRLRPKGFGTQRRRVNEEGSSAPAGRWRPTHPMRFASCCAPPTRTATGTCGISPSVVCAVARSPGAVGEMSISTRHNHHRQQPCPGRRGRRCRERAEDAVIAPHAAA